MSLEETAELLSSFHVQKERLTSQKVQSMDSFMQAFHIGFKALHTQRLASLNVFLSEWTQFRKSTEGQIPTFSLFDVLGVSNDELVQSRFLGWLLGVEGLREVNRQFLRAFFVAAQIQYMGEWLEEYRVRREFSGGQSIIDILVYSQGKFLIYLENKVLAEEGPSQADREVHDMRRLGEVLHVPPHNQYAVFLTPSGRSPTTGNQANWISLSYRSLAKEIASVADVLPSGPYRWIVEDWVTYARGVEHA